MSGLQLPVLPPRQNPWLLGLASATFLDPDECTALAEASTDSLWGPADLLESMAPRLGGIVKQANDEFFRFDLTGALAEDEPGILRLDTNRSLAQHGCGIRAGETSRKLTVLVALTIRDLSDPHLLLPYSAKRQAIVPGVVFVWPAFLDARLEADGDGEVMAMVAHVFGPAFR